MTPWDRVIISWINILQLLPSNVYNVQDILETQFFHNYLHEICGEADYTDSTTLENHKIIEFLREVYPKFNIRTGALERDKQELVLLLSLLLFHCIMKGSELIRKKMCRLFDEETQVLVKNFVESLVSLTDNLTRDDVMSAVQEAQNSSLKTNEAEYVSSTPKSRTLQIFLQTPATWQQKDEHNKSQEIRKLVQALNAEQCEKSYLVEELAKADEKLKNLSDKYEESLKEINKLKNERMLKEAEGPQVAPQQPSVDKKNNRGLWKRINELEENACTLDQEKERLQKQVRAKSEEISSMKHTLGVHLSKCNSLEEELKAKNGQIDTLMEMCKDLQKLVEEKQAPEFSSRFSLSMVSFTEEPEDLGSTVIDLKLCEEVEKNKALTEKLLKLEADLQDLNTVRGENTALAEELKLVREERHGQLGEMASRVKELETNLKCKQELLECLQREKHTDTNKIMSSLRDLCRLLWRSVTPLMETNSQPEEPAGPEEAVRFASKMVGYMQRAIVSRTAECRSLQEKCNNFRKLVDTKVETENALSEILAAQQASFRKRLCALENLESCAETAWCSLSLEALECAQSCLVGRLTPSDLREVVCKVRLFEERPDAHEWYFEKLRKRFKVEYKTLKMQLEAKDAHLNEVTVALRSLRRKFEDELARKVDDVKQEYKGKLEATKLAMKDAYNAEVAKLGQSTNSEEQLESLRERVFKAESLVEELKAKCKQPTMEERALQEEHMACGPVDERTTRRGMMGTFRDELEEDFGKTYLLDLKEGRCVPEHDRLGELRYRNSLYPPHLQSSYPIETMFLNPNQVKDEDLIPSQMEEQRRRKHRHN